MVCTVRIYKANLSGVCTVAYNIVCNHYTTNIRKTQKKLTNEKHKTINKVAKGSEKLWTENDGRISNRLKNI